MVRKGGRPSSAATGRSASARPSSRATPARCAGSPRASDRRLRRRDRRRVHPVRAARGQARAISGQLARACVELAKDWRTDRYLRRLEAMMLVADQSRRLRPDRLRRRAGAGGDAGRLGDGDRLGRQLRARRGARAAADATSTPKRSCAARWRSPPKSASTPTTISSSKAFDSKASDP